MRMKRFAAAKTVATCLFAAEEAIDIAVTRIAELNAAMPLARLDANISAIVGQSAFGTCSDALSHVAKAREQIVATHMHLKDASDQIGLQAVSFGDEIKPQKAISTEEISHLRIAS